MNETVERRGEVIRFDDDGLAQVRLERESACGQCGSRGTCGAGQTADQIVRLRLSTTLRVGDAVTVSTSSASVVVAALLGYALPAVCLLLGAILAELYAGNDAATVAGAALGFVAGLLIARAVAPAALGNTLAPSALPDHCSHTFHPGAPS
ncbi:SoxR reducing system RseC family protein [Propionivibrio dicarboxylicus]|uniref:Positive regulator of sigma(E), RseC/MucC n=1 Tax=Propionivibrio dicarboxylicus TaxID=83767 RepID=A0A1G7VDI3_9RHOO|nr:SoxR reducing system RseC family protein [Propionivibrio dicarboxylicus]SDG57419.1 positive regulator of sigma(E), RseC/MucC [Propionivibrio dicarboxylicus]